MSDGFTPEQEAEAARKISEAMKLLNERRWSKATQAQKDKQGRLMRDAREKQLAKARKAKRRKK